MDHDMEAPRRVRCWTERALSQSTVQVSGQVLLKPSLEEVNWALREAGII